MVKNKIDSLPFRPCVGMMIVNNQKKIFIGKRIDCKVNGWQMPQGGVDPGETPSAAVLREMKEEIGSDSGYITYESSRCYSYRVNNSVAKSFWNGQFCGQKQKWFLVKFTGTDSDININTDHPEFSEWKWIEPNRLLNEVVHFKYELYKKILEEFEDKI